MNISFSHRDAVCGILKIEVVKEDYTEQVETSLRDFRRKANIPGFRKGMVPKGMISKIYGKHVLTEEVTKLVLENLSQYIQENKIEVLGEPLPSKTEQKENDFDRQENFEFCFDIAFSPEIHIELTKEDKLTYYQAEIDDRIVEEQIESYRNTFGVYRPDTGNAEENDLIKGIARELENGEPKEEGLVVEDAVLMPLYIKDEEEKHKFIGAKKGSTLIFNPYKAYAGAKKEIAAFLKIEKVEESALTNDFSFEVDEITRFKKAELNQELFNRVLGEEAAVTDENTFREKIKESIYEQYIPQSDFKFLSDIRTLLITKTSDMVLADDILRRWLLMREEGSRMTENDIKERYPKMAEGLKYQLIRDSLIKENEIKVESEDVYAVCRKIVKSNYARFGMFFVAEEILSDHVKDFLKDEKALRNAVEKALEHKFIDWVKGVVTLDIQDISPEKFAELLQEEEPVVQPE
jgi:trigger factor